MATPRIESMAENTISRHDIPLGARKEQRVWVVLPAYNEAPNLPAVLGGLGQLAAASDELDLRVLLVDDGSADDTAEVALREAGSLPLEVLVNATNRGLAETFMRGMTEAARRANAADVVVCMDADNSHRPSQIPSMLREVRRGSDVVIASRYMRGSVVMGVSRTRRTLSRGMSMLFRAVFPFPGVRDYSCGYRAYRAGFLQRAIQAQGQELFPREGFACMVGILLNLAREGAVFSEVPLILRYDLKSGPSKMRVGPTITRTLLVLFRQRFRRGTS